MQEILSVGDMRMSDAIAVDLPGRAMESAGGRGLRHRE